MSGQGLKCGGVGFAQDERLFWLSALSLASKQACHKVQLRLWFRPFPSKHGRLKEVGPMSEWIRTHRGTRWVCLVSACVLAIVAAQLVAASPIQNQKKASADAKKSQPDSSPANKAPSLAAIAAVVNGEEITYKALAEEVIARNGAEVLETMIARLLVDQACRESGIKITSQDLQE